VRAVAAICGVFTVIANASAAVDTNFEAGLALYRSGQCAAAIRAFAVSEAAGEPAVERPYYYGVCLAKQGAWSESSARLKVYTEVRPEEYRGWYWLAQAQLYRRDFDGARTAITRAIALKGGSAEAYRTLGQVELERKEYNAAYTAWIRANQLNPADSRVTYYIGRLFYEAAFFEEAASWLRETLRLKADDFAAMTYLALCAEQLRMADTAVQLYRQAIRTSKEQGQPFSWAFLSYSKLLRQQGDTSGALALLEEAEKTCPEAHVLSTLGLALLSRGDKTRAESALRRAIALNPSISEAHYRLSLLLRSSGRVDEADAELSQFDAAKREEEKNSVRLTAIRKVPAK
jgi:Flp pilus assembly protein TadD